MCVTVFAFFTYLLTAPASTTNRWHIERPEELAADVPLHTRRLPPLLVGGCRRCGRWLAGVPTTAAAAEEGVITRNGVAWDATPSAR